MPETPSDDGNRARKRGNRRRSRRRGRSGEAVQQPEKVQAVAEPVEEPVQERPRTGNAAKPKRRNAQPRKPLPEFTESEHVVRNSAPRLAPVQPMRLRKIDPEDTSEPIVGCPMLTRTRLGIPFRGGQHVPRCSVGWAVHDEDEVLLCMNTPSASLCWKENPAHLEALVERLRPTIEAELASD